MAGTAKWFGLGLQKLVTGSIDLDSDTFKAMLTTSAYTPNQDTHDFRDDVTNEVAGTGYTGGGVTLTGVAVTYDATSNQVRISWADPSWAGASITARTVVIYKSRGGAASADELLCFITNDVDVVASGGTFLVDFPSPLLTLTAAA